ncbi:MAG: nucleotidyl transferase AbiEii/AbiGii toxin family protein [Planctomycetota bacterium]
MEDPVLPAAAKLQLVLEQLGRPFCFIGGISVMRWGEPRVTEDADAMVFTDLADEQQAIDHLLSAFAARRDDAAEFAKAHRVLLLVDLVSGVEFDISLGAFEYERHAAERASVSEYAPGIYLRTCSAEDLIVYKAFANRALDWHDIEGVLIRQQGKLDFDLIERELTPLVELKQEPAILDRWAQLRDRHA